jgi:flagellum-specific ATP synthase
MTRLIKKYRDTAARIDPIKCVGRVIKVQGLLIESRGPQAVVGELCRIEIPRGRGTVQAEVVGLREEMVQLMAYEETGGLEVGCRVIASGRRLEVPVSKKLLGRIIGPLGRPIDGRCEIESPVLYPALADPPEALTRRRISERILTGVRAIDGMLAAGQGQRLGIFAGSGVGKSTLLGMIARNTSADINVIALIGERGREVNDFIERDLGSGLARSVIVVSPSDAPPLSRIRGAYVATAAAEYFRDRGMNVMLLFDSLTRLAWAQREIGLAAGEPPATRGYPPSVFNLMPALLERCGTSDRGTITGFYTILVEGDDMNEPVADTVRGILDGHIVLSRRLAQAYHYPAIDILGSVSRLSTEVGGPVTNRAAGYIRHLMSAYAEVEDLINVGAYKGGSNPVIDEAIAKRGALEQFLIQDVEERSSLVETLQVMGELANLNRPEDEMRGSSRRASPALPAGEDEPQDDVDIVPESGPEGALEITEAGGLSSPEGYDPALPPAESAGELLDLPLIDL